jgi:hypothetical protein
VGILAATAVTAIVVLWLMHRFFGNLRAKAREVGRRGGERAEGGWMVLASVGGSFRSNCIA